MRIALLVGDFEDGGVERTLTNLAQGMARLGTPVDLLVGDAGHAYLRGLAGPLRVLPLTGRRDVFLDDYLAADPPALLMTGKLADDRAALAARERIGAPVRLVATVGTPLSARVAALGMNLLKRLRETRRIRADYARLDGITAVSEAVALDLRRHFGVVRVPLRVLPNPVVPPEVEDLAAALCPHPWLTPGGPAVVLAVGGLRKVKDFTTLLRAFARLREPPGVRLIILGEGKERERLTRLAVRLGVADRTALPGFTSNPYAWIARARLLVLSSRREGLGNVLVEAMALGTPVAATDCPGGVGDLLGGGRLGPLVPVGDDRALAAAIGDVLAAAPDPAPLRAAAEPYRMLPAARNYLAFLDELVGVGS